MSEHTIWSRPLLGRQIRAAHRQIRLQARGGYQRPEAAIFQALQYRAKQVSAPKMRNAKILMIPPSKSWHFAQFN